MTSKQQPVGRHWPLRDYPSVFWLFAALIVAVVHRWVPSSEWLLVHLVLLGALSHAIMVWSFYFCEALLRVTDNTQLRRGQSRRITLLLAGASLVLIGVPTSIWVVTLVGATLVAAAVGWHGLAIWRLLSRALPGRFRVAVRYYIAAATVLVAGATFGAILANTADDPWHGRLLLAHTMSNLLGWVGFTIMGTLITFWPTLLRTKMDARADRLARQALPVLIGGLVVLISGALIGIRPIAVAGLAVFAAGTLWWGRALVLPLLTKPPREFCSASVGIAVPWAVVGLVWVGVLILRSGDWSGITAGFSPVAAVFAIGLASQILTGALSYLIPSVLGGGPAVLRATMVPFNRYGMFRLVLINASLIIFLLPLPTAVHAAVAVTGLIGLGSFLPLLFLGIRANRIARNGATGEVSGLGIPVVRPAPGTAGAPGGSGEIPAAQAGTRPAEITQPKLWSPRQGFAALLAVGLAVTAGLLANHTGPVDVPQTGEVVRVTVSAKDMRFTPNQIEVDPGDRVVITLVNDDPTTAHDLWIAGHSTARLAPGQSEELDLGVITASTQGWCTIAGHKQMGMTFDIWVNGEAPASADHGSHASGETITVDPDATLAGAIDPVLAPLSDNPVHEITLTATEVPLEVAPGIWQTRWTFNGSSVGPTLHGRIGDIFEITLVNDGTMGHSIDFHAGELAPDEPMRTIPPGESLVYRFTANRAGIWMYHCSSMPMSSHIAAGMHGAVIIEPDDLPPVDRSYVLVQSEIYLNSVATSARDADEVNADKIAAGLPDLMAFNGVAFQYDQFRLNAKVGERIRFWVVDAGPNRASSFHIVGGQFDTVYLEGGYHLKQGVDAFGQVGGGAQALGLQPAQGGFVELVFPEAGNYPIVTHAMSDAEAGAHGFVQVTDD